MNVSEKEINYILHALAEGEFRDNLLEQNNEILAKIGFFILLVGKFEDNIKLLLWTTGVDPHDMENKTLGWAINRLEQQFPDIQRKYSGRLGDFRWEKFIEQKNIDCFISQCKRLRDLRNDLMHHFIAPDKSGHVDILSLLRAVEQMIQGPGNFVDWYPFVTTDTGDIRDGLSLEELIHVYKGYYFILTDRNL